MRSFRTSILVLVVMLAGAAVGFAAVTDGHFITVTIDPVQTIALENTTEVFLATAAPAAAGDNITVSAAVTKDLYYTLLATASISTITASLDANFTTGGFWHVELSAAMGTAPGSGTGRTVTLTTGSSAIIDLIGSTATTQTTGICPTLTYTLVLDTPASVTESVAQQRTLTLTINNL